MSCLFNWERSGHTSAWCFLRASLQEPQRRQRPKAGAFAGLKIELFIDLLRFTHDHNFLVLCLLLQLLESLIVLAALCLLHFAPRTCAARVPPLEADGKVAEACWLRVLWLHSMEPSWVLSGDCTLVLC